MDNRLIRLSPTRVSTFQRCTAKYHWQYVEGMEGGEDTFHLEMGSAFHEGIAAYYGGAKYEDILTEVWRSLSGGTFLLGEERLEAFSKVDKFLTWYIDQDRNPWKVIEIEQWKEGGWDSELGRVGFITRWDLVVELPTGGRWIVDHKFSQKNTNVGTHTHSLQASIYLLQAELLGQAVEGVIFNMLNWKAYGVRQSVIRRSSRFLHNLKGELANIHEQMKDYKPTRNFTSNCYWDCQLSRLCLSRMEE